MVGHGAQIGCVRSSTARLPTSIAGLLTRSSSARRRSPTSGGILCCRPSWGRVSRPVTRCGRRIASTKRRSRARCGRGSGRTRSLPPVNLLADATHLLPDVVALRREIHRHPELGLELPRTQALVLDALDGLGMSIRTGTALSSVVADLHGEDDGPTVVLRGDMDALPMPEDTGVEFASSVDGVMHACGHDAHAAMLVGAARLLVERRASLRGTVRFMFQPGEEGFAGARSMIDDGVLDQVDSAFALHVSPNLPSGSVWTKGGALMASANAFSLRVTGRGGHASAAFMLRVAEGLFGTDATGRMPTPVMGAEDFSYVLQQRRGAMAFLGVCPPGQQPARAHACHSNRMTIDEDAMRAGVALYAAT